ncbi:hypothetical protein DMC47_30625 [Nostoc sp. 3335mG]|nr:hypothetical protein DMC47_30625 [Nostoc sp. 3335mG]
MIVTKVQRFHAAPVDQVDLLDLHHLLTLFVDEVDNEHLLLSDGLRFLRIDVVEGTLIGCPAVLAYLIEGIDRMRGPMRSIERLLGLKQTGRLSPLRSRPSVMAQRWITELRVADALSSGADQQEIARTFYGDNILAERWRSTSTSYRTRIQRLVRSARSRLAAPLAYWFETR